jgi:hypothetical protein
MRDKANKHSLELCASIVLLFLDGCSKWYVSVVFLAGQVLGNWKAWGSRPDKGKRQCLVMGISWSRDPQGFQHLQLLGHLLVFCPPDFHCSPDLITGQPPPLLYIFQAVARFTKLSNTTSPQLSPPIHPHICLALQESAKPSL